MEIKCPSCSSIFNLPDSVAQKNAKLRCSVCGNVFALGATAEAGKPVTPPPLSVPNKKKILLIAGIVLLLGLGLGTGAWFFFGSKGYQSKPPSAQELAEKVELLSMRNVRQYYVDNEKAGRVFVIEGRVVNEFPQPKELIVVEATLYDTGRNVLATKKQMAGTQLSLFQLQVLSEKEMESFLNNQVEILTNNTNLRQGAETPFMILFYAPPPNVSEFGVRIVDVRDVPNR